MSYKKLRTTDLAENRKNEIIGVALKLFSQEGYHSTTLDKVAAEIGVSKATLYYYFRNKEEIIRAILDRSLDRMKKTLDIKKTSLSTTEKLRQFVEYHVVFGADDAELAKITFEQLNILPKRSREVLKRKQREIVVFLQDLLQQGVDEGIIKVGNNKIAAFAIIGMCNWTYHWYKPGGQLTPGQISELYINLLENGYLVKMPPSEKEKKK
jgi:TetR/AcrR family transcriptional regulator, cholesterol catabolism regulator